MIKRESRRAGEGGRGAESAAGEMPRARNKTRFHLARTRGRGAAVHPAALRGSCCQARLGTATPNKAVTHPRAGADSKQSDRRISRMLIQTARSERCQHPPPTPPAPLPRMHAYPRPRPPHPWHPSASCGAFPSGGLNQNKRPSFGGRTRPLGVGGTCSVPAVFLSPWMRDKSQLASGGLWELRGCNPLQEVGTAPR